MSNEARTLVRAFLLLAGLLAVVGPGDAEHDGDHEGQLGVGAVAVVEVDDGVEGPGGGADSPYPCGAAHHLSSPSPCFLDAGSGALHAY